MENNFTVPTMAEITAKGEQIDILFWVGCAGSFDDRAKKVTKALAKILHHVGLKFAVLGKEESCTGDPAKRAGNELLFQVQAMQNISTLNAYNIKKNVTACPHCFNTLKNEYTNLGGSYEVQHHTALLQDLIVAGKVRLKDGGTFQGKRITFHDPCYLGRGNDVYDAPRSLIEQLDVEFVEMKQSKKNGLCCGAGGAQMFKEAEKGNTEVNHLRAEQAISTQASVVATGCPFCKTMLTDGMKHHNKENIQVLDIAELVAQAADFK
jgi:Fe-S oxidoreductase